METRTQRFIICAVGAVIGTLVTFFIPPVLTWWMGALIGTALAYTLFSWKEIREQAPAAARLALTGLTNLPKARHQVMFALRSSPWTVIAISLWGVTVFLYLWPNIIHMRMNITSTWGLIPSMLVGGILGAHLGFGLSVLMKALGMWPRDKDESWPKPEEVNRRLRKAVPVCIPVVGAGVIILMAVVPIVRFAVWPLLRKLPVVAWELLLFTLRFLRNLYLWTHSWRRVVMSADAGIAVVLVYVCFVKTGALAPGPTLLIAGLLGGVLGVLHFELADRYVTPRLQALQPQN